MWDPNARYEPTDGPLDALYAALSARFDNVVDRMPEQIAGYPQVIIALQEGVTGTVCDWDLTVTVLVVVSRTNDMEMQRQAARSVGAVTDAAAEANAVVDSWAIQPFDHGGMTHFAAVHNLTVH